MTKGTYASRNDNSFLFCNNDIGIYALRDTVLKSIAIHYRANNKAIL